ncbi:hypothetical protein KCU77_g8684, partial [Aureobasidium melanogenum]
MVLVNTHSTTFTDVVVEFFSGRRSHLTVLHSIEAVLKSLRQPPSFKNTIRLEIIKSTTNEMFDHIDLIKRISVINPFVIADRHIDTPIKLHSWYFPDDSFQSCSAADRHIVASTDGSRRLHSWYFPDDSLQSCSESSDGCYTPDSEASNPVEEYNGNNEQPLAETAPSHSDAVVNIARDDIAEGLTGFSVMVGVGKALVDIVSYLRANPNFLEFEPCIRKDVKSSTLPARHLESHGRGVVVSEPLKKHSRTKCIDPAAVTSSMPSFHEKQHQTGRFASGAYGLKYNQTVYATKHALNDCEVENAAQIHVPHTMKVTRPEERCGHER